MRSRAMAAALRMLLLTIAPHISMQSIALRVVPSATALVLPCRRSCLQKPCARVTTKPCSQRVRAKRSTGASIWRLSSSPSLNGNALLPTVSYEDDDLLILNKPAGIGFHDEEDGSRGILSVVRTMQEQGKLTYTGRLFGVHRLDKVTSGCLVLAKSPSAAGEAISALRDKKVAKYYVAISDKKPSKKMGTISGDMQRTRRSAWRLANTKMSPAVTRFLHRPFSTSASEHYVHQRASALHNGCVDITESGVGHQENRKGDETLHSLRMFVMRPLSGKTHQLRVALRALSAPILGDVLYYPGGDAKNIDRTYLHATALRLPMGNCLVQVVVPPWEAGGALFACPEFRHCYASLFKEGMERDKGVWFAREKGTLLSDPDQLLYKKAAQGGRAVEFGGSSDSLGGESDEEWEG